MKRLSDSLARPPTLSGVVAASYGLRMLGTREIQGLWWLPEDESANLVGTLQVTDGEAELELVGHFGRRLLGETATERSYSFAVEDRSRIIGLGVTGERITLERCAATRSVIHGSGIETSVYRPDVVLIGKAFAPGEEVSLDEVSITASDLNTWTGTSGTHVHMDVDEDPDTGLAVLKELHIRYQPVPKTEIPLPNGDIMSIEFSFNTEGLGGAERVGLTEQAALRLRFGCRITISDALAAVGRLRNFLSLAVGRPVTVISVHGYQEEHVNPVSRRPEPIELLWRLPHNPELPSRRRLSQEMLFTFREAEPQLPEVLANWFAHQDALRPVFSLFFGIRHHANMYVDVRFLLLAQALETYDFRRRDPYELPKAEHRTRRRHLIDAAPEAWREWVRRKLIDNYLPLDRRIRDVLAESPTVSARLVGSSSEEVDAFVAAFKNSRNYYTHYTPQLEAKAAKGAALLLLVSQLEALVETALLRELGFSEDAIDRMLDRAERYRQVAHWRRTIEDEEAAASAAS